MAKVTAVKKNGKPVAASVSTGNRNGTGPRARAGLCPAQNAINQIKGK